MDCTQTDWLTNEEYLQQFNRKAAEQRIPLSGSIDLTHRCNLRCVHCYLGDKTKIQKNDKKELSTAQWFSIIDQITEAGCLDLLITGGEPLLRKDFSKIYTHSKKCGLLVTVFTNGTLITSDILELFTQFPPKTVEISLYGATAETYEKITGIQGSYEKCLKGIHSLLDHKIILKLKTILMTINRHEFYNIENMAKAYGVKFRFDAAIFPCFNGDKTPLKLRVQPEEVVAKEFSDPDRSQQWKDFFERMRELSMPDTLYNCGTGLTCFHIDPYGHLQPCLMVTNLQYNLLEGDFMEGWQNVIPRIRQRKAGDAYTCNRCEKMTLCGFCPGFFEMENGAEDIHSDYLCEIAKWRFEAIQRINNQEDKYGTRRRKTRTEAPI